MRVGIKGDFFPLPGSQSISLVCDYLSARFASIPSYEVHVSRVRMKYVVSKSTEPPERLRASLHGVVAVTEGTTRVRSRIVLVRRVVDF